MPSRMTRRLAPSVLLTAAAFAVPLALLLWLGHRTVELNGDQHFAIVVVAASCATGAALALFVLGARKRERRAVITGGAFLAMASLLAVHGAATPGLLVGDNSLIAFAGGLTLPAGAVLLLMGAHPAARRPGPVGPLVALLTAAALAVLFVGALGMAHPHSVPAVPRPGQRPGAPRRVRRDRVPRDRGGARGDHRPADPPPPRPVRAARARNPRDRPRRPVRLPLGRGRLLDGPRHRAARDPAGRRTGGDGRVDEGPVPPPRRRPPRRGPGGEGGGVPRPPRACAAAPPGGEGHGHGGAHPPRRPAGRAGGRGDRPARHAPAPARPRRDPPRHRQAPRARRDPEEAGGPHRRGVRRRPPPPRMGRRPAGGARLPGGGPRDRARPPRAPRRRRLPGAAGPRRSSARRR